MGKKSQAQSKDKGSQPHLKTTLISKKIKMNKKQLRTHLLKSIRSNLPKKLPLLQTLNKTSSFLKSINVTDLTCSICMQLLLMPFSLECGHTFCFHCLDSLSQHPLVCNLCPCCRSDIGNQYPVRNKLLQLLIGRIILALPSFQISTYNERRSRMISEFERRSGQYKGIKVNEKIDFKVGNHWQVGKVIKIYKKEGKLKIEVQAKDSQMVYVFNDSSTHLASYRSFTNQPILDICEYFSFNMFMEEQEESLGLRRMTTSPSLYEQISSQSLELMRQLN